MPLESEDKSAPSAASSSKQLSPGLLQRLESSSSPNLVDGDQERPTSRRTSLTRSSTLPIKHYITASSAAAFSELEESSLRRFRQWLWCVVIVQFDVDYGPRVDFVTPSVELPASERDNIAFAAFPDTSNPSNGTEIHSFRIRSSLGSSDEAEEDAQAWMTPISDGFLYVYCAFTQQRDKSSKRGYMQRSLVFLSQHPLPALFSSMVATCTPMFLEHGYKTLETACHNISHWPPPQAGSTLELGFLGKILHVELPQHIDQQQLTQTSSFGETFDFGRHILAAHPPIEVPAVEIFSSILPNLWSLWECIVLSEPVFVHGASPSIVSSAIWWLRDWLRPIPLAGDSRPYFTIHDPDHKRLVNKNTPQAGIMLGTTNPFLAEECKHWPHVLSLSNLSKSKSSSPSLGPPQGFRTTHRRYISKDRALLKELEDSLKPGVSRAERLRISNVLRQHFASRANSFLVPLNRYLTSLIPTPNCSPTVPPQAPTAVRGTAPASTSPGTSPPQERMAPFNASDMIASLKRHGSPLPFKSAAKRTEFYERWLRTNASSAWLMREEATVTRVLAERRDNTSL